jgi:hypothetical protein
MNKPSRDWTPFWTVMIISTVFMTVLKLAGLIGWPWAAVLAPVVVPVLLVVTVIVFLFMVAGVAIAGAALVELWQRRSFWRAER